MSLGAGDTSDHAAADALHVRSELRGPCLLVEADGELTILTAERLREHVLAEMREVPSPPRVVLDAGGVGFCDSSGLNALIIIWKAAHRAGGEFVLADLDRRFRTIIERSGLDRHLVAHPTAEQALDALAAD
ncbi:MULTISPECIES: STAS domain-containing protein [Actinomadura]|uniref:Anti-sigma factor antagonist n=1 Tax=Actinomadura geliboluensis TaxID=882440 RepID=A0A5S4H1J7_9ACTN|nr:STAS domain-containing protein [Actinomadura geliboluensis]TMR39108.1 STAS domain-containing protein [Actinomadura geliboluensis]